MAAEEALLTAPASAVPGEPPHAPGTAARASTPAVYDPLLGKTYAEIGTEARSMHKCQGMAQLLALPGPAAQSSYQLVESTHRRPDAARRASLFDGIDTSVMPGWRSSPARRPPKDLTDGLAAIANAVADRAEDVRHRQTTRRRCSRCSTGLRAVRALRARAAHDADRRRRRVTRSTSGCARRSASSSRPRCSPTASASTRWPTTASLCRASRSRCTSSSPTAARRSTVKQVKFDGFDGNAACTLTAFTGGGFGSRRRPWRPRRATRRRRRRLDLAKDQVAHCEPTLTIPADARVDRALLASRGRGRPLHVRRRRAVWPAVSGRRRSTCR